MRGDRGATVRLASRSGLDQGPNDHPEPGQRGHADVHREHGSAAPAPRSGAMSMGKLQGKVAVITGGTAGIGLAAAKLFVAEGAYVFITGRRKKELDGAVEEIGDNVLGIQGDVTELADLDRLYETVGA